jgi:hypothetical protein
MTRATTPQVAQPAAPTKVPHERIAMRAYEKWLQRGCPHGTDQMDWLEAEAELTAEVHRPGMIANATTGMRPAAPARPASPAPQPAPAANRRR